MLTRDQSPLDWNRPAARLYDQVRGLNPWPCATAELFGQTLKVLESAVCEIDTGANPVGTVLANKKKLIVVCGKSTALELLTVQPAGKRAMPASAFLAGKRQSS
jgi:methionyl-tRNA formyltransferase